MALVRVTMPAPDFTNDVRLPSPLFWIEALMTTAGVKVSAAEAARVLPVLRPMVVPLTEVT